MNAPMDDTTVDAHKATEPAPVPIEILPASHEDWAGLIRRAAQSDGHEARVTLEIHQRLVEVERQLTRTAVAPAQAPVAMVVPDLCWKTELLTKIDDLLDGIDRHEDHVSGGWWQTRDGARIGRIKLRELKVLILRELQELIFLRRSVPAAEEAQP
jgi:hypothetical protein